MAHKNSITTSERTNRKHSSSAYKRAIRSILNREHLDEEHLHQQVRKSCFAIVENRVAIDAWYDKLQPHQKMIWNSPDAVLRHWRASLPPSLKTTKPTKEDPDPTGMLADMAESAAQDIIDGKTSEITDKDAIITDLRQKLAAAYAEIRRLKRGTDDFDGSIDDILPAD